MSTRLNAQMRKDLADDLLRYRFEKTLLALRSNFANLAGAIYADVHTGHYLAMTDLPEGWLPTTTYVKVQLGAVVESLDYAGDAPYRYKLEDFDMWRLLPKDIRDKDIYLPTLAKMRDSVAKVYDARNVYSIEFDQYMAERETLWETFKKAKADISVALNRATTIEKLIEAWPEVEPFAKRYQLPEVAKDYHRAVPVVQVADLNKLLDLPVPEQTKETTDAEL